MTAAPIPASRWRASPAGPGRGAADRVRRSHAQALATLRLALAFVGAAALAGIAGRGPWLPLHLFLAGGVVLAISGVSLMLTVTWSAAPAPPDRVVSIQRALVACGGAGVAAGRELGLAPVVVASAGTAYLAGLGLLAVLLVATARRGVERRFDPAVSSYLAALAAGAAAVGLGVAMAVGAPSPQVRAAHVTLNLLGLVGLVVGGTLPFFAATVGRSRMAPHATARRLTAAARWQATALAVAAVGLAASQDVAAGGGLAAYAVGIGGILWLLPRPNRRGLRWAGPRLLALWAGALWWAAAVAAAARDAVAGHGAVFAGRWLAVLVVAGYAQILWGSLAYLLPMLRGGGHEQLGRGFATTRSWAGLVAANAAGVALVAAAPAVAATAVAVWVVDTAARVARVWLGGPAGRPATRRRAVVTGAPIVLATVVAVVVVGCGSGDRDSGGVSGDDDRGPAGAVEIVAEDIGFPEDTYAATAGTVAFAYRNEGSLPHTLVVEDVDGFELEVPAGGDTDDGTVRLEPGTYTVYCDIAGHREAGMEATLEVR